jgi:hypothetical protein
MAHPRAAEVVDHAGALFFGNTGQALVQFVAKSGRILFIPQNACQIGVQLAGSLTIGAV